MKRGRTPALNPTVVVSSELQYKRPKLGLRTDRKEVKLASDFPQYITTGNRKIRFTVPNSGFADFRKGYLSFNLTLLVGGAPTYSRLANMVSSIFERFRLTGANSGDIENVQNFNLIKQFEHATTVEPDVDDVLGEVYGVGTQAQRNLWATATKQYVMPLGSNALGIDIWPLKYMTDNLIVEYTLDDPTRHVETDGTTPVITLDNVQLHYDKLVPDPAWEKTVATAIGSQGLEMGYRATEVYQNVIAASNSSNIINHRSAAVDYVACVLRTASTLGTLTTNDRLSTWIPSNVTNYYMKLNNDLHPEEPIDSTTRQAYLALLRFMGKWHVDGLQVDAPTISPADFASNRFIMTLDLRQNLDKELINQTDTSHMASDITFEVRMSAPPPAQLQMDSFVQYYTAVFITPQGKVQIRY